MSAQPGPSSREGLAELLAAASEHGRPHSPIGGGTRSRMGPPGSRGEPLSTGGLRRVVEQQPADLTITVEGGLPVTELAEAAAQHGQFWPQVDPRPGATVGGVLATAASHRARLRYGPVRDSVLQMVLATGDGRLVRSGGPTVKGVAGYDLHRVAVGSLGTLGVIVEATIKLWPLPPARAWFGAEGPPERMISRGVELLGELYRPAAVLLTRGRLHVELVGHPADVTPPAGLAPAEAPAHPPGGRGLVQVGVPPARTSDLCRALELYGFEYEAQLGVGSCLVGVNRAEDVATVRARATEQGGHATVLDAPEELRADAWGPPPPGRELMRRVKHALDPARILNPGLAPGGL